MPSASEEHKKDDEPTGLSKVWSLRIDNSSNVNESGAHIVLESMWLEFPASNNEAEYKALLAKL